MSQICYQEVPLESVVQAASLVLVVHPADPPISVQEIPITPPELEPGEPSFHDPGEPLPPYSKVSQRYVVEEVILDETGLGVTVGQTITAARANWENDMDHHIDYHFRGLSKSPIYRQYRGKLGDGESPFIVFLSSEQEGLRMAFDGARERLSERKTVLRAISQREPAVRVLRSKRRGFWSWLFGPKG